MRNTLAISSALVIGIALVAPAEAVPLTFNHSGRLNDALGAPLTGFNSLAFSLHSAPSGGSALWAETQTVEFSDGYYSVQLGKTNPLDPTVFDDDDIYLAIAVNGGAPMPTRVKLESVPWSFNSLNAETATNVDGGVVNASEIRINGTTVIDSSGTPDVDWSDLTGIPSDFADGIDDEGASGLPSTCAPAEIAVFNGSGWTCDDAFNHTHSADDIDGGTLSTDRLPMGASSGSVAWGDHSHGGFADASHTHSSYADSGHTHTATGVDALSCSDGQVPVWNSSAWECGDAASGGGGGSGLLFSYELDGAAPYEDFSGGGSDLTWDGLGLTQGAAGHSGTGVDFSNGILIAPTGNSVFDSPTVTVEAWIQPALPTDGDQTILEKEGTYRLYQTRGAANNVATILMEVTLESGDTCSVESDITVDAGTWASVSGTYNGRTVSVAVDDDWVDASCDKGPLAKTGGSALNVGAASGKSDPYNGLVDEVRGWAYAPPTDQLFGSAVLQTRVYSDYTRRTTGNGGVYYFGGSETGNVIQPRKADSTILVNINYFGEANTHDVHTRLQYRIGGGGWQNFDLVGNGQQGTMKVGAYPDTDYNSTPHNHSTQVARSFSTTEPIYFRMYHFNGGTFYHNNSVSTSYETGPSTLVLTELNANHTTYEKR